MRETDYWVPCERGKINQAEPLQAREGTVFYFLITSYDQANNFFSVKKLILTSERRVEHPFAGRNTQQRGV